MKKGYLQQMFPREGEFVSRVRFSGFADNWVECKLEETGVISAGGDLDKSKLIENGFPVLANALTNDGVVGYYDDYKVEAPAVTITGRGDVGHAKARITNFTPVVRLLTLQPYGCNDAFFLESAINNLDIFVESTGVPQLTSPQLSEYTILIPVLSEQAAIGNFFRSLDRQITAQISKVEQLKQLKSAYLQRMLV